MACLCGRRQFQTFFTENITKTSVPTYICRFVLLSSILELNKCLFPYQERVVCSKIDGTKNVLNPLNFLNRIVIIPILYNPMTATVFDPTAGSLIQQTEVKCHLASLGITCNLNFIN